MRKSFGSFLNARIVSIVLNLKLNVIIKGIGDEVELFKIGADVDDGFVNVKYGHVLLNFSVTLIFEIQDGLEHL